MRVIPVLKQPHSLVVIAMAVGQDDVFDRGRIKRQLLEALDDLRLGGIVVKRTDENDTVTGLESPGRVNLRADPIEIVEHLVAARTRSNGRASSPVRGQPPEFPRARRLEA